MTNSMENFLTQKLPPAADKNERDAASDPQVPPYPWNQKPSVHHPEMLQQMILEKFNCVDLESLNVLLTDLAQLLKEAADQNYGDQIHTQLDPELLPRIEKTFHKLKKLQEELSSTMGSIGLDTDQ